MYVRNHKVIHLEKHIIMYLHYSKAGGKWYKLTGAFKSRTLSNLASVPTLWVIPTGLHSNGLQANYSLHSLILPKNGLICWSNKL